MNVIRRHPIGAFLAATYILVGVIFAVPLLATTGLGILPIELPGIAPFLLVSTIALAVVAFAVTAIVDGREGVRELRARAFRFRVSPIWYATALFVLPLAALAVAMALQGTAPLQGVAREPGRIVGWLIEIVVALVLINFWEEIGWTGFVLHRLQPRLGPMRATVATTWAQAAFHLPLLFIVGGVSDTRLTPDQYPFYLAALFILPLGSRTVLTWLYNASRQSLPVAGLTHSSWNFAAGPAFLPALVPGFDEVWAFAGFAVVAVTVIVLTRGRLAYDGALPASGTTGVPTVGSPEVSVR
jgi:membrane protease YdiL (CAAX protease family)